VLKDGYFFSFILNNYILNKYFFIKLKYIKNSKIEIKKKFNKIWLAISGGLIPAIIKIINKYIYFFFFIKNSKEIQLNIKQ